MLEKYRSGHNEHDWKSCCRDERHAGSNPAFSAKKKSAMQCMVLFLFMGYPPRIRTGSFAPPVADQAMLPRRDRRLCRRSESRLLRHVGAKYALLRFSFTKKNTRLLSCSSFSAKSHARLACSVASALATARCRYQLFAARLKGKNSSFLADRPKKKSAMQCMVLFLFMGYPPRIRTGSFAPQALRPCAGRIFAFSSSYG